MRILHVIPSIASVRGGTSQAVLEMVTASRELGIEAEVVTTNDNGFDLLDVPLGNRIIYQQIPVWFFPRLSPAIHSIREFAFSRELTAWLWQNIANYDLLHIHAIFSYTPTIAMVISRLHNIPYIVSPHGLLCDWSLHQSTRKKQIYLSLIERENLNHSKALHFTSKQEQDEVSRLGLKSPSFTLPLGLSNSNGIPDARLRLRQELQLPDDQPLILFMSRLHPKKGLDYLIPALSKLQHHQFTFILAGSGSPEYETEVKTLLSRYQLEDRTHCTGFVIGEMKDLLIQGSDVFVLTSHSENFGISVLEAMAAGLAVIITPGVGLSSVVTSHRVGYVPQLSVDEIASSIAQCLANPQEMEAMGNRAHYLISEKYTWKQIIKSLLVVYTSVLQRISIPAL